MDIYESGKTSGETWILKINDIRLNMQERRILRKIYGSLKYGNLRIENNQGTGIMPIYTYSNRHKNEKITMATISDKNG